MNTNINNKKFKLVSLRNQPMQAFSCKQECDKEASGDGEREEKGGDIEIGDKGWIGGRLKGRDWEKKLWRPLVWFVLVLTTLKNRWTLFLIVVIVNPHVYGFPFIPWLLPFTFILPVLSRQWYAAPITEEKMSHHGQFSYDLYICIYTHIYTLINALNQKYFSCSFPFLCQSRRGTPGEWDENRETSEKVY